MSGVIEMFGEILGQCWLFLVDTEFTVSGITFSLANVLEVDIVVGLAALLIRIFIVSDGLEES